MKNKKINIVNNFNLLTESQRLPNMLGKRLYNMLGQRLYNTLGQHFLDEQSADGFAFANQRWPNENCSLKPNVGPTSTCYLGLKGFIYTPDCTILQHFFKIFSGEAPRTPTNRRGHPSRTLPNWPFGPREPPAQVDFCIRHCYQSDITSYP